MGRTKKICLSKKKKKKTKKKKKKKNLPFFLEILDFHN